MHASRVHSIERNYHRRRFFYQSVAFSAKTWKAKKKIWEKQKIVGVEEKKGRKIDGCTYEQAQASNFSILFLHPPPPRRFFLGGPVRPHWLLLLPYTPFSPHPLLQLLLPLFYFLFLFPARCVLFLLNQKCGGGLAGL